LLIDQLSIHVASNRSVIGIGETAQFIATASGINKNNFLYQWNKRDSNILANKVLGVNGTMLTIPSTAESDEGQYYCIVTNEWNHSVKSDDVTLVIHGMDQK